MAVQGRAVGCTVRLEKKQDPFARGCGIPDSVNFREVEVGVTTSRVVYLYNETSEPCRFCFSVEVSVSSSYIGKSNGRRNQGPLAIYSRRKCCTLLVIIPVLCACPRLM